jgi:DNA-binding LytR/AlgR family response regulator
LLGQITPDFEVIEVIDTVSDSIKWLRNHQMPDLIFSDIQLADGLSFEIYETVQTTCPIIFTTAYDAYMLEAFQTNGIDYLLKPLQKSDLERSVAKFRRFQTETGKAAPVNIESLLAAMRSPSKNYKSRFLVKVGTKLLPITTDQIAWFRSADGAVEMHTRNEKRYVIDQSLDELDSLLDPDCFFRINRQFIGHIESIDTIHQFFKGKLKVNLRPMPHEDVIVSRERSKAFRLWIDGSPQP